MTDYLNRFRVSATFTAVAAACLIATGCGGGGSPEAPATATPSEASVDTQAASAASAQQQAAEAALLANSLVAQQSDAAFAASLPAAAPAQTEAVTQSAPVAAQPVVATSVAPAAVETPAATTTVSQPVVAAPTPVAVQPAVVSPTTMVSSVTSSTAVQPVATAPTTTTTAAQPVVAATTTTVSAATTATSTSTTAPKVDATTTTSANAIRYTAVDSSSVIAELRPSQSLSSQGWQGLNCYGQYPPLNTLPTQGLDGAVLPDGTKTRFGQVADPLNSGRTVFMTRVQQYDPLTASGNRCELIAPPAAATALPMKQDFWYAFSILVWDGNTVGQDQVLSQWHVQGYNPFFDLAIKDGKMRIEVRYQATAGTTTSTIATPWRETVASGRKWMTFVVQARISPFASDSPYIKVWRDGVKIVDRNGPIGYNTSAYHYAKIGYYSWTNMNTWDTTVPDRRVYIGGATLLRDPTVLLTEATVRNYLNTTVR